MWVIIKTIFVFILSFIVWNGLVFYWLEDFAKTLSGVNELIPFIFGPPILICIIYLIKKTKASSHKSSSNEQIEIQKENFKILENRKFQFKLFIGTKITWTFNEDGNIVNIKAGWLGINSVNAKIKVESLGNGNYIGRGYKFSLKDDCIITSGRVLKEIKVL